MESNTQLRNTAQATYAAETKYTAEVIFTDKEQEVINLLLSGATNEEMETHFKISRASVVNLVHKIVSKTGSKNRTSFIIDFYKRVVAAREESISFLEVANKNLLGNYARLAEKYNKLVGTVHTQEYDYNVPTLPKGTQTINGVQNGT